MPPPIRFYHRDQSFYEFTNFSPHPILFQGRLYPTAEHLFQAHKFMLDRPDLVERIRRMPSSRAALDEATRLGRLRRADRFSINMYVMDNVLEAKFTQYPSLGRMLLSTGECELVEDSPVDAFWGVGEDRRGRNELGKALMRLRAQLRQSRGPF